MIGKRRHTYASIQSLQEGVTGSRTLVVITFANKESVMFLVDCGMYQGSVEEYEKNGRLDFKPKNLDFVILTHAHIDHCGQIPVLFSDGDSMPVYMTEDTMKIAEHLLDNTAKIVKDNPHPIFNYQDLERAKSEFRAVDECVWEKVNLQGIPGEIRMMFIRNEHIPGAASVCIEVAPENEQSFRLFFSGDYNISNAFSSKTTQIPCEILDKPISFFLMESTYGKTSKKQIENGKFAADVEKAIVEGKSIFATAFAYGRMQNILLVLKQMQERGTLSKEIPIYLDGGLGISLTMLFPSLKTVDVKDFLPDNLTFVTDRKILLSEKSENEQKIIVATSGMGNYGPAHDYIPAFIEKENWLIYITGFAAEGSNARKIAEAEKLEEVFVSGIVRIKKAEVCSTSEFSSHAKKEELIDFVKGFKKIEFLAWNHGSKESKEIMAKQSYMLENVKNVGIIDGMTMYRVNKDGYVKEFPICSCTTINK